MTDIVLQVTQAIGAEDELPQALARFLAQREGERDDGHLPLLLMKTINSKGVLTRLLTFRDSEQAIQFLRFWKEEAGQLRAFVRVADCRPERSDTNSERICARSDTLPVIACSA